MTTYVKNYPRPQLVRSQWTNLNGLWFFLFDDHNIGEKEGYEKGFENSQTIHVPFTYETILSGIHDEKRHDYVWYQREFECVLSESKHILLHFEGSDYITKVWVNGKYVGMHRGGYTRFFFDITDYIVAGTNRLVVKAEDSFDTAQPRGKQRWRDSNFGCWYVQTTGIWKTVWLEEVSGIYINGLKMTPDLENACVAIDADVMGNIGNDAYQLKTDISYNGNKVISSICEINSKRLSQKICLLSFTDSEWGIHKWTPDNPELYDVKFSILSRDEIVDEVYSYFGMREISIDHGNILLNGAPIYQQLILDQGYWAESGITAPSEDALIEDIDKIKQLGFNGLRKHMKIEDERFLYWCDVKGMLVWSEMPAAYEFCDSAIEAFTSEWLDIVRNNYNHPSIITWVPFNESWGIGAVRTKYAEQNYTEAIYHLTKSIDPMRPVIVNDGWEHTVSDIITLHDYEECGQLFLQRYLEHKDEIMCSEKSHNKERFAFAEGYSYRGQPVIISEYGGIAFADKENGQWGYGNSVQDETEFLERFEKITDAIKKVPYIVGYCYTQVSDVEQEVNGLLTMERTFKIAPEKIAAINSKVVQ